MSLTRMKTKKDFVRITRYGPLPPSGCSGSEQIVSCLAFGLPVYTAIEAVEIEGL